MAEDDDEGEGESAASPVAETPEERAARAEELLFGWARERLEARSILARLNEAGLGDVIETETVYRTVREYEVANSLTAKPDFHTVVRIFSAAMIVFGVAGVALHFWLGLGLLERGPAGYGVALTVLSATLFAFPEMHDS